MKYVTLKYIYMQIIDRQRFFLSQKYKLWEMVKLTFLVEAMQGFRSNSNMLCWGTNEEYLDSDLSIRFITTPSVHTMSPNQSCGTGPLASGKLGVKFKIALLYKKWSKINFIWEKNVQNKSCSKWSMLLFQRFIFVFMKSKK